MILRWGLLGTARINRLLIPALRASDRSVIAAVASRDPARGAAYAAEWELARVEPSYDALLASPVDIVYNALPNSLHVPWTLNAVAAGKHVLCEKPLALCPADVDAVRDAASRAGVVVMEGFMYRHHAQTHAIMDVVGSGALGDLRAVVSGFSYMQSRVGDVRLDPALGGGALWDIGCYPVSIAQLLAGTPVSVSGHQVPGPTGVDLQFSGTIAYQNRVTAQVFASFTAAYQTFLRVIGTHGVLEVDRPFRPEPLEQLRLRRDTVVETVSVRGNPPFVDEVTGMEDAVLGLHPPRVPLEESRRHAATLAALYESARTREDVCLA